MGENAFETFALILAERRRKQCASGASHPGDSRIPQTIGARIGLIGDVNANQWGGGEGPVMRAFDPFHRYRQKNRDLFGAVARAGFMIDARIDRQGWQACRIVLFCDKGDAQGGACDQRESYRRQKGEREDRDKAQH